MRNRDMLITAPYPEAAIMALARRSSEEARLARLVMPSRLPSRLAKRVLMMASNTSAGRRLAAGSDLDERVEVAPSLEVRRLFMRTLRHTTDDDGMDRIKQRFDRSASRVQPAHRGALLAMPGAALETFSAHAATLKVLHQVDGHPIARNAALREVYGKAWTRETVRPRAVDRILAELESADIILTPSSIVTDEIVKSGITRDSVIQTAYGVNETVFTSVGGRSVPSRRNRVHILYIGQVSYRKGIPFLADAARGLNVTVELVGPVVASELLDNLPSNVTYRGALPHADLQARLAEADALVLPSIEENFGLVVTEALSSGLPVIASDAVGAKDLLTSENATVIPRADVSGLRQALRDATLLSSEIRDLNAARFRQRVQLGEVNTWTTYCTKVLGALEQHLHQTDF
jgi:glycosyltransferase involved in cell wall biosynthesis